MRALLVALLGVAVLGVSVHSARAAPALTDGGWAVVRQIIDGATVVLADGRTVHLVGIEAPAMAMGDLPAQPYARDTVSALAQLVLERNVRLLLGATAVDRYGWLQAHLYDAQGRWIQGEILARGLARVHSLPDNRALVSEMLALEATAREARVGLWASPAYSVLSPEQTAQRLNGFAIVQARVLATDTVDGRIYLNFGPDWRTDFTVSVSAQDARVFRAERIDLLALAGHSVRVRGWLYSLNGPMIDVTHPEQIELLNE